MAKTKQRVARKRAMESLVIMCGWESKNSTGVQCSFHWMGNVRHDMDVMLVSMEVLSCMRYIIGRTVDKCTLCKPLLLDGTPACWVDVV